MVKRVNGIRVFEDKDFPWLRMLNCLKNLNMPIKKIKDFREKYDKFSVTLESSYYVTEKYYAIRYGDKIAGTNLTDNHKAITWSDVVGKYKKIKITGGSDVKAVELIHWLYRNATLL